MAKCYSLGKVLKKGYKKESYDHVFSGEILHAFDLGDHLMVLIQHKNKDGMKSRESKIENLLSKELLREWKLSQLGV